LIRIFTSPPLNINKNAFSSVGHVPHEEKTLSGNGMRSKHRKPLVITIFIPGFFVQRQLPVRLALDALIPSLPRIFYAVNYPQQGETGLKNANRFFAPFALTAPDSASFQDAFGSIF
jgi:hypothetical protein